MAKVAEPAWPRRDRTPHGDGQETGSATGVDPFVLGALAIRYDQRQVSVAGRPVELTGTEYELLRVLSLNAGRVSACESLLRQVSGKPRDRAAMVALRGLVKSLRRKLGDVANEPAYILTERSVGYRMPRPARSG